MKFLVDECVHPSITRWLQQQGYDVVSVKSVAAGIDDAAVLKKAYEENRILITHDKGFGERIFKQQAVHNGIILLRVMQMNSEDKISILKKILDEHKDELLCSFIVATDNVIRVIPLISH